MSQYKSAYELELDALDLDLCLDTDYNQADYDGSRSIDEENGDKASQHTRKNMKGADAPGT